MIQSEIGSVFASRKDYMRAHCPIYRLGCEITETLEEILRGHPGFPAYAAERREAALSLAQLHYERGQALAGQGETLLQHWDHMSQEELLLNQSMPPSLWDKMDHLIRIAPRPQRDFLCMYDTICSDREDFELMYAVFFGIEAGGAAPEFLERAQELIEPNSNYEPTWWPVDGRCFF